MLLPSQITNTELDCTVSNTAVYRATLNVTNGENCSQIISVLGEWISTSPSVVVESIRLRIASYCDVEFESFDIQTDCVDPFNNNTGPATTAQTTDEVTGNGGEGIQLTMIEIIAVSTVGGLVGLLLILTLLVICCVFVVRISRISKIQYV